jgi:hypothetical protein
MTDELRERLGRLDPMHPAVPTESVTSQSSKELLEKIMSTPPVEQPETQATPKKNGWLLGVAAAAALVVAVGGAIGLSGGGGDGDPVAQGPPLELSAGAGDLITASCIQFSVEYLAPMPVAFEGTVTGVDGDEVALTVDHWFKGGDATQVVINAPQGLEALIASFPLEVGEQYLITASDGNVNYCGFSGPSTPEFRASFEEAFGS